MILKDQKPSPGKKAQRLFILRIYVKALCFSKDMFNIFWFFFFPVF